MTPEGKVKQKVKKALDLLGADCWRFMPVQTGYGSPALDFLLSIRGHFVAIETKAPGKKLTPLQEGTKAAIEAAGGIVLVVWDESSLAIALKIILALEFSNAPQGVDALTAGLQAVRSGSDCHLDFTAHRVRQEAKRPREQHVLTGHASHALDAAVGGDHGAPGKPPHR